MEHPLRLVTGCYRIPSASLCLSLQSSHSYGSWPFGLMKACQRHMHVWPRRRLRRRLHCIREVEGICDLGSTGTS